MGLTTLPPSCADCLEIWEPQRPVTLRVRIGIVFPFIHCSISVVLMDCLNVVLRVRWVEVETKVELEKARTLNFNFVLPCIIV